MQHVNGSVKSTAKDVKLCAANACGYVVCMDMHTMRSCYDNIQAAAMDKQTQQCMLSMQASGQTTFALFCCLTKVLALARTASTRLSACFLTCVLWAEHHS